MFAIRLHRARKASGLSYRALALRVGLSQTAIKKYEDGIMMPSSDVLLRLSRALNVRTEYFFRPEKHALKGIEYRKHNTLAKKRLHAIENEVLDYIERRIELEELFPQPPVKVFTPVDGLPNLITDMNQIEFVAERVREIWELGLDPIPHLIDTLETNGIRVFMIDADADNKFDGLAANLNGMPIIVVGIHWPGDRQRFTLAHELGHLMLKDRLSSNLDEENACHRFAGAFLLPKTSLVQELGKYRNALEVKELGLLKEEFGLSMAAILYRARDIEIISTDYHIKQLKLFRKLGWNKTEPGKIYPTEKAHIFEQLLFHALAEGFIGESKAAELMNQSLPKFRRIRSLESVSDAAN